MNIRIEQTGKASGYEEYHNNYWDGATLVATSDYDKNQKRHIAVVEGTRRRVYRATPQGIAIALEKLALNDT